jgi:hypothetical protein
LGPRRSETLDELLCATAGLFARRAALPPDGAEQQRRLREEWTGAAAPVARRTRRGAP